MFRRRTLTVVGIAAGVIVLLLFFQAIVSVLLLVFAGILLAVILSGLASRVSKYTNLPRGWSLALVLVMLVAVLVGAGWFLSPSIATQLDQLSETLPQSTESIRQSLSEYSWGRQLVDEVPAPRDLAGSVSDVWSRVTGVFSTALSIFATAILILMLGIYMAADPDLYKKGLVMMMPQSARDRTEELLDDLGRALWGWLMGQLISMTIIGVLVWLGLTLIGVPLALSLGLIAGLFEFVPLIGAWAGSIPGVLVALMDGPTTALWTVLLYLGIQQLESNVITPIVMKEAVSLPPAVTLTATVLAGVLFGIKGILLATPLAVVAMVLIRGIYIHDVLGDRSVEAVE